MRTRFLVHRLLSRSNSWRSASSPSLAHGGRQSRGAVLGYYRLGGPENFKDRENGRRLWLALQRFSCELTFLHLSPIQNMGPLNGQRGFDRTNHGQKHFISPFVHMVNYRLRWRVPPPQLLDHEHFWQWSKKNVDSHVNRCKREKRIPMGRSKWRVCSVHGEF